MAQFGNHRPFSGHKIFINWFIRNLIQTIFKIDMYLLACEKHKLYVLITCASYMLK
jgi:hypothetical protein